MTHSNDPLSSGLDAGAAGLHPDQDGVIGKIAPEGGAVTGAELLAHVQATRPGDARAAELAQRVAHELDGVSSAAAGQMCFDLAESTDPVIAGLAADMYDFLYSPRS